MTYITTIDSEMRGSMKIKKFFNIHILLLLIFLLTIGGIVYKFFTWGQKINLDEIDFSNTEVKPDTLDLILPAMYADGTFVQDKDDTTTIVCFGNAPFADDRESPDNLANLIAQKTGATVYNCSIGRSLLAGEYYTIDTTNHPNDAYNFYWLTQLACKNDIYNRWEKAADTLGEAAAPEAKEVYDTLWNLDFNEVDVIAIMYDANDYLYSNAMYNDENPTDITQFTGNLEAGIELLQANYPHLRFIVLSPTYAFAIDEDDNYVSSDQYTYGWDVLSTYVIKEHSSCFDRSVTFVDNLYGTITEDNAKDYLIDNLHLNVAGRKLVADRFVYALNYYNE